MTSTFIDRLTGLNASAAVKVPVVAATTAAITLSGLQTIDGIVLAADDRVLVKDQADNRTNGIYIASTGIWNRSPDFDDNRDALDGTQVIVAGGTVNTGTWNLNLASNPLVIGTQALTFTPSGVLAGSVTNTQLAVVPAKTVKGNNTTATAAVSDLTSLFLLETTATKVANVYSESGAEGFAGNILSGDFTANQSGKERYSLFIPHYDDGTNDGTVPASSYGLGVSALKTNWQTTTRAGQVHGLSIVSRGGFNGADPNLSYNYGDTAALVLNSVVSSSQSFVAMMEGVSYYGPAGDTTDVNAKGIRVQIGGIRAKDNNGIGLLLSSEIGALGAAVQVQQKASTATFSHGFRYLFDLGAGSVERFSVQQQGALRLKGATSGSKIKDIRASVSVDGDLEIVNDAGSAVVAAIKDGGSLALGAGAVSGGYASYGTTALVQSSGITGVELASSLADADQALFGGIEGNIRVASAGHDRVAAIRFKTDGGTANKRGGRIVFSTKADNVGGLVDILAITSFNKVLPITTGVVTLGQSGFEFLTVGAIQYTSGANKVVGARDTGWAAMTGSPDKATAYATSTVTLAQLAGRVAQLQASLTTHGLIGA